MKKWIILSILFHGVFLFIFVYTKFFESTVTSSPVRIKITTFSKGNVAKSSSLLGKSSGANKSVSKKTSFKGKKGRVSLSDLGMPTWNHDGGLIVTSGASGGSQEEQDSIAAVGSIGRASSYLEHIRRIFQVSYPFPYVIKNNSIDGYCAASFYFREDGSLDSKTLKFHECTNAFVRAHFGKFIRDQFTSSNSIFQSLNSELVKVRIDLRNTHFREQAEEEYTEIRNGQVVAVRYNFFSKSTFQAGPVIASPLSLGAGLDLLWIYEKTARLITKERKQIDTPYEQLMKLKELPDY